MRPQPFSPWNARSAERPAATPTHVASGSPEESRTLFVMLVGVTLALGWILLPYWGTLMWASITALIFAPVNRLLLIRLPGRRNLAALLTLLCVLVIVVLPLAVVTLSLAREWASLYARFESGEISLERFFRLVLQALPDWVAVTLERLGMIDFGDLQRRLGSGLGDAGKFMATKAVSIGQNTFDVVLKFFLAAYVAFFLIRDGKDIARTLRRTIPLSPAHRQQVLDKFTAVIRATVKGTLVVAVIQGTLGALAFWFLGVGAAVLWGVLMAFSSLVPAIGAALVWLPVALYLFLTGDHWQSVALVLWGVIVVGLVDNLLRPILVGRDTRMPDYVVLITTLGGMSAFGINGFVLGPVIAAMFLAVWHIRRSNGDGGPH